jgi:LDH2 family malate/lactate/ureidoglycolate dehydrogenase
MSAKYRARLTQEEARALATRAFERAGVAEAAASDAAEILTLAQMMGIDTHGLGRVAGLIERMRVGGINPGANVSVSSPAPALRHVDGQNGLGPAVARLALAKAMDAAQESGIGACFCMGANHLGALAPYLWIAAEAGFAAIVTTNTAAMIAPAGGRLPQLGNNPLGIGMPYPGGDPVLLDMALSVVSRSRVRNAAQAGTPIPDTWGSNSDGRPTTDAAAALDGMLLPIGGYKGAGLALGLDLLAGVLSGASFLGDVPTVARQPDAEQNLGHMFILIDAQRLMSDSNLAARMASVVAMIEGTPPVDADQPVRLPGARAVASLRQSQAEGVPLDQGLLAELRSLAG